MKQLVAAAACAIAALGAQAQEGPQTLTLEGIAATVNDKPITFSDVRERARLLMISYGAEPNSEVIQQLTGQALEQLIDEELQLQEAAEYEVDVERKAIEDAVADVARQAGTDANTLYQQLLGAGINPASLENQMKAEIAWRRIMGGLYGSRIRISPNQIDDQVQRLEDSLSEPQYLVSEIFLAAPDQQTLIQARQAAQSIVDQLKQGAPFDRAAALISSAPTSAAGGDMGWVALEDLRSTAVAEAVEAATQPGLLGPIEAEDGIYVLAFRGKREPQSQSELLGLRQLIASTGGRDALSDALEDIDGCEEIDEVADEASGLIAVTLGSIRLDDLNPETRERVRDTPPDGRTEIFDSSSGPAAIFVCSRATDGGGMPSREQIENRLFSEELGMVSDRALRNLRREATIIRRGT